MDIYVSVEHDGRLLEIGWYLSQPEDFTSAALRSARKSASHGAIWTSCVPIETKLMRMSANGNG